MTKSGAGVTAMLLMLDDLTDRMVEWPMHFHADHAEKCGGTGLLVLDRRAGARAAGRGGPGSRVLSLIYDERPRKAGEDLPPQLRSLIASRRDTLRQQRDLCAQPYTARQEKLRETAALLPEEATLERLMRYETHAERSLQRSVELLARLRGSPAESLSSRLLGHLPDGTDLAVEHQRTRHLRARLATAKLPNVARSEGA